VTHAKTLVIIPTFNERENIAALVERILSLHPDFDVLVVDDASPDGTSAVVSELQQKHPEHLHLITRTKKDGRGGAVLEGFRFGLARDYALFFEMDADFSHRPEDITLFLESIRSFDVVVGSRYLPGSRIENWSWRRTHFSRWANTFAKTILRIPLSDYTNGFRCYRRNAVEALDFQAIDAKGYVVLSEVAFQMHRKGLRLGEVPVIFVNRERGISNLTAGEITEAFLSVLRIRWPGVFRHKTKRTPQAHH